MWLREVSHDVTHRAVRQAAGTASVNAQKSDLGKSSVAVVH